MKNVFPVVALSAAVAFLPVQAAHAGLFKKLFVAGSVVVGGVALSKAQAAKHCSATPADPQCEKHVKGTDADPALAGAPKAAPGPLPAAAPAPVVGVAPGPKPAKDPNAMIDAGAAKAKDLAAKGKSLFARMKAEHEAKKAARAAAAAGQPTPGAPVAAAAPTPAK